MIPGNKAVVEIEDDFLEKARKELSIPDYNQLKRYIEEGKHPLAPDTIGALFNLYLAGSSLPEIQRLNKTFPYCAILWASVKYNWREKKDQYIVELQEGIKSKVIKAQLETTTLLSDLLSVAYQQNEDKLKRYLQTKNAADLGDALSINSLEKLMKIVESLRSITGQSNTHTVKNKTENSLNVNLTAGGTSAPIEGSMSPESAEQILEILAREKRKPK